MRIALFYSIFSFLIVNQTFSQQVIYVDSSAQGLNNGTSWANAYKSLDSALQKSHLLTADDSIYVAKGTYKPALVPRGTTGPSTDRDFSFHFPALGNVIGGFPSGGGVDQDTKHNPVILSGDIGVLGLQDDNVHHVTFFQGSHAFVDGFTIRDGFAEMSDSLFVNGVGLARDYGAGMISLSSDLVLSEIIMDNNMGYSGGGIKSILSKLNIAFSVFTNNFGLNGGGIYNDTLSTLYIYNSVFFGNLSEYGGAIYNHTNSASGIFHSTFVNNTGYITGGAIMNYRVGQSGIRNCIFSLNNKNVRSSGWITGDDIYEELPVSGVSAMTVDNSLLQALIGRSECVYGGDDGFVDSNDPDGPDNIWATADDGLVILPQSPAFNTGRGGGFPIDITENLRDISNSFDMGAYEIDPCSRLSSRTVYIDSAQGTNHSGNSWSDAINSLQAGINLFVAGCIDTIKVAKGTYYPSTVPRGWSAPANFLPDGAKAFHLPANIVLMGGYNASTGNRDFDLYPSVLSPDLTSFNVYDQTVIVVSASNITVDGFTIANGNADGDGMTIDGQTYREDVGGGMFVKNSEITISNTKFINNKADALGGGLFVEGSLIKINNSRFERNHAYFAFEADGGGVFISNPAPGSYIKNTSFINNKGRYYGGGLALHQAYNQLMIDSCVFNGNTTEATGGNVVGGGAFHSYSSSRSTVSHSRFENNIAFLGGALNLGDNTHTFINQCFFIHDSAHAEGGAIFMRGASEVEVGNSVFYNNSAPVGGAFQVESNSPKIQSCTFYQNKTTVAGGAINDQFGAAIRLIGSIFWENTLNGDNALPGADIASSDNNQFQYNSFQTYSVDYTRNNFTGINPFFRDSSNLIGPDGRWGTGDDGLQLLVQSQLFNEVPYGTFLGPNPSFYNLDIKGDPRIQNKIAEMGAYEMDFCGSVAYPDRTVYVDSAIFLGNRTGNSWQNALPSLDQALKIFNAHCGIDTIKIAKGTYTPMVVPGLNSYSSIPVVVNAVFSLPDSITLKGGYPSGGGARSVAQNPTIFDGLRLRHLLFNNVNKVTVDGFIIERSGFTANGSTFTMNNSVIRNTWVNGPPVDLWGCTGTFNNCVFDKNLGTSFSGAVEQKACDMYYINCVFTNNVGQSISAGAIRLSESGRATVTGCTFFGNREGWGGAIMNNTTTGKVNVSNSVFWRNRSNSSHPDPFNHEIWMAGGNFADLTVSHSLFQYQPASFATDPNSIYGTYPLFADSSSHIGPDGAWATSDDGLVLTPASAAYNAGNNSLIPAGITTDIAGFDRIANDTTDMGAYEFSCLSTGNYACRLVPLGTTETSASIVSGCGDLNYYVSQVATSRYIAMVNENENIITTPTITVDASTTDVHFRTNGLDTTAVAYRMISVVAPGTFTTNGGVRVRIYYDSTEFNDIPKRSRQWFKHPGHTKASVLADLTVNGLQNAVIIPGIYGTENGVAYVEFRNITSFSTFGLVASNISSPLPVGMLYFTAKQVGDQRKSALKWATAWEENNDRFELERSDDGSHWAVIGTVRGSGSVASESTYNFIDDVPSVPLSYYRIKQVDIDGNTSYSATRLVDFSQTASDEYNIYPNPASSRVYIDFVKDQKTVNYELVDLTGRTVLTGAARNTNFIIINTDKLNSGIYFLRLNGLSKKIVINK